MFKRPLRAKVNKILSAVICVSMLMTTGPVLAAPAPTSELFPNLEAKFTASHQDSIQPAILKGSFAQLIPSPYSETVRSTPQPSAAFSTAKAMNMAQWEDGASIIDYSSVKDDGDPVRPENAIDYSTSSS